MATFVNTEQSTPCSVFTVQTLRQPGVKIIDILFQMSLCLLRTKKQKKSSSWSSNFDGDKGRKKPAWVDEDDDKVL